MPRGSNKRPLGLLQMLLIDGSYCIIMAVEEVLRRRQNPRALRRTRDARLPVEHYQRVALLDKHSGGMCVTARDELSVVDGLWRVRNDLPVCV